jgi:hypothetical protein
MFNKIYNKLFAKSFERHSIIAHGRYLDSIYGVLRNIGVPLNTTRCVMVYDYGNYSTSVYKLIIYVTADEWNETQIRINEDGRMGSHVKTQ